MPFNEETARRVRTLVQRRQGFTEKKLFGGIGFLLNDHLCCGVWKNFLILRVGPEAYHDALADPFAREFNVTGKAMTGWVMIAPEGYSEPEALKQWIGQAIRFVRSLPPKESLS